MPATSSSRRGHLARFVWDHRIFYVGIAVPCRRAGAPDLSFPGDRCVVIPVTATMAMDRRSRRAGTGGACDDRRPWHCRVVPSRSTSSRARSTSGRRCGARSPSSALARNSFDWRWALAVVLLAAGLLGDFQTVVLGEAPVLAAGIAATWCARRWRAALPFGGTGGIRSSSPTLLTARRICTFDRLRRTLLASGHQLIHNILHLPRFFCGLLDKQQPGPSARLVSRGRTSPAPCSSSVVRSLSR